MEPMRPEQRTTAFDKLIFLAPVTRRQELHRSIGRGHDERSLAAAVILTSGKAGSSAWWPDQPWGRLDGAQRHHDDPGFRLERVWRVLEWTLSDCRGWMRWIEIGSKPWGSRSHRLDLSSPGVSAFHWKARISQGEAQQLATGGIGGRTTTKGAGALSYSPGPFTHRRSR